MECAYLLSYLSNAFFSACGGNWSADSVSSYDNVRGLRNAETAYKPYGRISKLPLFVG